MNSTSAQQSVADLRIFIRLCSDVFSRCIALIHSELAWNSSETAKVTGCIAPLASAAVVDSFVNSH